jgi:4-diphosphocytidyl-2-C-methyl-D-erythritol kinase
MTLRIFAPAKINLHLGVGAAGPDGYHAVETVLQALAFGDALTITDGDPRFECTPSLGLAPEDNLAWRAAEAMAEAFARPLDVAISVVKSVPAGAGLGGASADAAAVIVGLAALWEVPEGADTLCAVARSLGADVPFFLEGGAAHFTGRGDVLARRLPSLEAPIVLVKPAEGVPTGAAYAAFDGLGVDAPAVATRMAEALETGDASAVARCLHNAMTPASTGLVPAIADALALVAGAPGVLGASMAGSGSAVFGICADAIAAENAAAAARSAGFWATATSTYSGGCLVERA